MKDEILRVLTVPRLGRSTHWHWIALAGIIFLAACLRLYQLDTTPPGFHYDEAFNAMQARDVLRGTNRPIFFTGNFGEEPMQMYVEALVFALAGESPYTARLSNVLLGLALIPALYFCAHAFFPRQRVVAFASACIGATMYWAINFSRIGIETNSLPWILTLSAGTLMLANEERDPLRQVDWRLGALAGLLTGAVIYTYLASRVWPVAVALWFVYLFLFYSPGLSMLAQLSRRIVPLAHPRLGPGLDKESPDRPPPRADGTAPHKTRAVTQEKYLDLKQWLVIALFAGLAAAPLVLFFVANPVALSGRAGQVLTPDQFGSNLLRTAGMFFISGDTDPRDNLPGRPALDPVLTLLFIVGLVITLARARKPAYAFLLIWFVMMTLPSALTEFAPNFRRAIGAMPAVILICGVGAGWIWNVGARRWKTSSILRPFFVVGLLALGLAYSALSSAQAYFNDWAHSTGLYYSFDGGLLEVAQSLAARPAQEQLCLSPGYNVHPTVLWAMDGRAFSAFDGRRVTVLPDSALPATCAIITHEDQTLSLMHFYPNAQLLKTIYDLERKPYAQVFHIPAGAIPNIQPQQPLDARVGKEVRVLGYDLDHRGERIDLNVYWRVEGTLRDDYTIFVHLLGPLNPASDSPVWSQDDAQPGHGTYPTSRWRIGQTIIDRYRLSLPGNAPPANYQFEVGMYLLSTGARQTVWLNGQRAAGDRLLFGEIKK